MRFGRGVEACLRASRQSPYFRDDFSARVRFTRNVSPTLYPLEIEILYDAHILKGETELAALRRAFPFRVYRLN